MKKLKFNKEINGKWFIDLPEYTGSKDDLEMIMGADNMLDLMAAGDKTIHLYLSENEFEGADKLEFIRLATELDNGAFYKLAEYRGIEIDWEIWLCDVATFVFGSFPSTIFISVAS